MGSLFSASGPFAKLASIDPIAQALHLPGSQTYATAQMRQQQANAEANGLGPAAGQTPTLAGAQAGYVQGGPGTKAGWTPYTYQNQGGVFGALQNAASLGNSVPWEAGSGDVNFAGQTPQTASQMNAYNGTAAQPNPNPVSASMNNLFGAQQQPIRPQTGIQPVRGGI